MTGADWERLAGQAEQWAQFIGHRADLRMADGHCAALQVGDAAAGACFTCRIYEQRPQACRSLEYGSAQCAAEVQLKGAARPVA